MQQRAAIWILEAFCTSPTVGIEAIKGLISTHLHLQNLSSRFQLRMQSLPMNHIFKSMLESWYLDNNNIHCLLLKKLTPKQQLNVKESIVDANNRLDGVFPSFIPFSSEFLLGNRLIDIHPSCFSFHFMDKHKECQDRWRWTLFYFPFSFLFYFSFPFLFHFSIFRTTRVRVYQSQIDGVVTRLITRLGRKE